MHNHTHDHDDAHSHDGEHSHEHAPEQKSDHGHAHDHSHGSGGWFGHSHHHDVSDVSDGRLLFSVVLNLLLTVVEVVAGIFSGSLSLLADAAHNFNDSAALLIAYIARRIARRGADERYTFGYRRAELIGAMINLTTLVVVGLYLLYEAVFRLIEPEPILGQWVVVASSVALVVDLFTAFFLWSMADGNLNIRAAFIHNLTDAAASVAVLCGGLAIWMGGPLWLDPLLTALIAFYILYLSIGMLRRTAAILMENAPPGLDVDALAKTMAQVEGVVGVHHIHIWELDEQRIALEAHVVLQEPLDVQRMVQVKMETKALLKQKWGVSHSTLEFEFEHEDCAPDCGEWSAPHHGHDDHGHATHEHHPSLA